MAITIQTAGILKEHIESGTTVDNVSTVGEAVEQLGLPHSGELIVLVNGKPAYWNTELSDGDTLSLLPGISGGRDSMLTPRTFRLSPSIQPPPYVSQEIAAP